MRLVSLFFPAVHLRRGEWLVLWLEQAEARAAGGSAIRWWCSWWLSRRVILFRGLDVCVVAEEGLLSISKFRSEESVIGSGVGKTALW